MVRRFLSITRTTPDALRHALQSLRAHIMGRVIVVFGAGGDRDKTKREMMGQVAAQGADEVIVTDDNPRGEAAKNIRAMVMQGCPKAQEFGRQSRGDFARDSRVGSGRCPADCWQRTRERADDWRHDFCLCRWRTGEH